MIFVAGCLLASARVLSNVVHISVPLVRGETYAVDANESHISMRAESSGEFVLNFWKPVECWGCYNVHARKFPGRLELTVRCPSHYAEDEQAWV